MILFSALQYFLKKVFTPMETQVDFAVVMSQGEHPLVVADKQSPLEVGISKPSEIQVGRSSLMFVSFFKLRIALSRICRETAKW